MPLLIGYIPWDLDTHLVLPETNKKQFYYDFVSDEKIIIDKQTSKAYYYIGGAIIILALLMYIIFPSEKGKNDGLWFSLILILIGLLMFIYAYTVPRKEVILDRKKELFSFPDWFYKKPHTVTFKEAKVVWSSTGGASGSLGMMLMVAPPKSIRGIQIRMHTNGFDKTWSFMVWYMDKNRPLPPGNAFDPFRENDFLRRKNEGFPPPLYNSRFPTPEATPKQNAERRKHWKDEDYYGTSESAWY